MNRTQIEGLIRDTMKAAGAYFVTAGAIGSGTLEIFIGLAVFAGGSFWSWYSNKTTTMISAVASSNTVEKVVTTKEIAKADPNPKVTSSPTSN